MLQLILPYLHFATALIVSLRVLARPGLEPSARLAWVLVVEALPFIGAFIYLAFGEVRMARADRERRADIRDNLVDQWVASPFRISTPPIWARNITRTLRAVGGMEPVAGNRVSVLPEDDSAFSEVIEAIDAARDHVHMLFYIWLDDHTGRAVAEAAIRAAQRGLEVRVIVDALGSRAFTRTKTWKTMRAAGVQTRQAYPLGYLFLSLMLRRLDLRNHRKIIVIDNHVAFTGSRNCADTAFRAKPRYAPWVDLMVRLEGPAVRQMQTVFLGDWMSYGGGDLGFMIPMTQAVTLPGHAAQIVATGPDRREGTLADCLTALVHAAQDRLTITTPYYVPDRALDAAIRAAARRGVDVTLILPERNDSMIVGATSEGFWQSLVEAGVKIRLFQPGLLHAKIMTVDGRMAMIGSANLDMRSFHLNYEMNMLCISDDLVATLDRRQQSYLERARILTPEELREWPRWRRIRNNLMALASPLL